MAYSSLDSPTRRQRRATHKVRWGRIRWRKERSRRRPRKRRRDGEADSAAKLGSAFRVSRTATRLQLQRPQPPLMRRGSRRERDYWRRKEGKMRRKSAAE